MKFNENFQRVQEIWSGHESVTNKQLIDERHSCNPHLLHGGGLKIKRKKLAEDYNYFVLLYSTSTVQKICQMLYMCMYKPHMS